MPYDVILSDPPWQFKTYSDKGKGKSPERHYSTLPLGDLCRLPVRELAAESCALFLWATWTSLFAYVPSVLDAWGFTYRTLAFIWIKSNPKAGGFFSGCGYYTRANSEPCLLAVRGRMPVSSHGVSQVIYSPVAAHSQKPAEVYDRIERLYPGKRYLELFARDKRLGWAAWGNQVQSDIDLSTNPATWGQAIPGGLSHYDSDSPILLGGYDSEGLTLGESCEPDSMRLAES